MEASTDAMEDIRKLIATQITETIQLVLPQQIAQQLALEREKQVDKDKEATSESENERTPTPSEAMRIARGKGITGASRFQAVRNVRPVGVEVRVPREPRHRAAEEPRERRERDRTHRAPTDANRQGHHPAEHP
ncbi:unnamed protein product, partial [Cochlearia groenlandica]